MHSIGLYSAAGTCFNAAACTTISMPRIACCNLEASLTSPMKKRIAGEQNSCCISYCFSSSREKTTTRLGFQSANIMRTKARPKDPVPPVIRTDLSSNKVSSDSTKRVAYELVAQYQQSRREVSPV